MDITYIPMARVFVYLAAVVDWYSGYCPDGSLTMYVQVCLDTVLEAISQYGIPEIFTSDQGDDLQNVIISKGYCVNLL